jgi:hypothetical protein
MKIKHKTTPDVSVRNEGTLFLFCPLTPRAKEWINANVQADRDVVWYSPRGRTQIRLGISRGHERRGVRASMSQPSCPVSGFCSPHDCRLEKFLAFVNEDPQIRTVLAQLEPGLGKQENAGTW